jgi:hypothetical protein
VTLWASVEASLTRGITSAFDRPRFTFRSAPPPPTNSAGEALALRRLRCARHVIHRNL